jgi:superfamily I DNA and/or RNA helicase
VLVTRHGVAQKQIAALTPYSAQKEEIKKYLKLKALPDITVKTVTESQGD